MDIWSLAIAHRVPSAGLPPPGRLTPLIRLLLALALIGLGLLGLELATAP